MRCCWVTDTRRPWAWTFVAPERRCSVVVTIMAGAVTAYCGRIAFLDLVVPHLCRGLLRTSDYRRLILAVLLLGTRVGPAADRAARSSSGSCFGTARDSWASDHAPSRFGAGSGGRRCAVMRLDQLCVGTAVRTA